MPNRHDALPLAPLLAAIAAAGPSLLAYNDPPSPTFLNQALALALWGGFVLGTRPPSGGEGRGAGTLLAALALLLLGVCLSWGPGALPTGLALSAIGLLLAAAVLVVGGTGAHAHTRPADVFAAFCWGWLAAGLASVAIALVQVFLPALPDGDWIAASGYPGRAVGNLRQPNHLSSLLLWSAIAVVALLELRRIGLRVAAVLFALLIFAVVLTASRTGLVSVALLAVWALADRRLSRQARGLLLAAPLVYAASWLAMAEWAKLTAATFGGAARLAETDISTSRFAIWSNTLAMIARDPWTGVGFGEFNFAWTLTPFPGRPTAFFDHTHNLPLHLAVELGLPLGGAVLACLLWGLWVTARRAWGEDGDIGTGRRAGLVMVLMIGLHSLLEYPLWYAYFLLPAAWAWAFAIGVSRHRPLPDDRPSRPLTVGALALVVGSVLSVFDYLPVARIFSASDRAPPLEERIARGQRSVLFAHHADYAAATTDGSSLEPFERATHYLLDTRLMIAWAKALAANGDVDEARFLAARLREFRNPNAEEFLGACKAPEGEPPFQCSPPTRAHPWREFLRP